MPIIGQASPHEKTDAPYFSRQIHAARRFYNPDWLAQEFSAPLPFAGGWESCEPGYLVERSDFPYYAIEFVAAGEGTVTLNGRSYPLMPGAYFTYGPGIPHGIENTGPAPLEKYFLNLRPVDDFFFRSEWTEPLGTCLHSVRPHSIGESFEELIEYALERNGWSEKICSAIVKLLALKLSEASIPSGEFSGAAYETYTRCVAVINRRFAELRGLEEMADACGIDQSYLCRLFRKYGHRSPYQYHLRLVMNHAADLLTKGGFRVAETAAMIGYPDPMHFSRTFKKVMGISPSRFALLEKTTGDAGRKGDE